MPPGFEMLEHVELGLGVSTHVIGIAVEKRFLFEVHECPPFACPLTTSTVGEHSLQVDTSAVSGCSLDSSASMGYDLELSVVPSVHSEAALSCNLGLSAAMRYDLELSVVLSCSLDSSASMGYNLELSVALSCSLDLSASMGYGLELIVVLSCSLDLSPSMGYYLELSVIHCTRDTPRLKSRSTHTTPSAAAAHGANPIVMSVATMRNSRMSPGRLWWRH